MRAVRLLVLLGVLGVLAPLPPALADEGPWQWPLAGSPAVSRDFAPPEVRYAAGHRGVDLPAPAGSAVLAAGAGQVTYAGLLAGRGVVVVAHGSLRTTYEPVTASVAVGAAVAAGDAIGVLEAGHLGCPVAACLHWGLRRGADYLDPVRLVERGPVRLLPVGGTAAAGAGGPVAGAGGPVDEEGGLPLGAGPPPADRAPAESAPALPARPRESSWSLRAAEAPLGAAAVAALVVGIGLLARPRPGPPGPVSGGVAAVALTVEPGPTGPSGELLDLDAARLRRRAG